MKETAQWWWKDSAEMARLLRQRFPEDTKEIMEKAERIAAQTFCFTEKWEMEQSENLVAFQGNVEWEKSPSGDPEWVFAMNRHTGFFNLGQAYLLTGDKRWYERFAALLQDWVARVPLTKDSINTTWRTIEAGIRCENWLKAYCCFRDCPEFSEGVFRVFRDSLRVHGEYLYSVDDDFRMLSNWGVLQNHGLFLLGVS